jgi:hypothetical protein
MDCKNTDNKYFFVGNASVSLGDFSKLPDQTVDRVSVQLQDILRNYQKNKYITIYNCTAEVIKSGNNLTPKNVYFHCNLANPSNTSGIIDYSLFTYYKANPSTYKCARCAGQVNCNACRTCMKCGDCYKYRDYADHSSYDVNKDICNTMQRGNNYSDFVGLVNTSNFVPKTYTVTNIQQLEMYFTDEGGQRINYFTSWAGI